MSDPRPGSAGTIHNERVKLLAGLLNTMAGSSFTVGVAAPVAAAFFYNAGPIPLRLPAVAAGAAAWLVIASVLHLTAQRVLGRLRE